MTDQEVLAAIERICGDEFCEGMEWRLCTANMPDDLKTAVSKLGDIYRLAHSHVRGRSCYHTHDSWRKLHEWVQHWRERAEAKLVASAEDKARLDWLEENGDAIYKFGYGADDYWVRCIYNDGNVTESSTLRAAIDAAKGGK